MNVSTGSPATRPARGSAARPWVWRASLGVLVLIVIETGLGLYVMSNVTVPEADHNAGLSDVVSNGPATLSIHTGVGLLLGLGALGVLVQSIITRRWGVIALSVAGLLALVFASVAGTGFTSSGDDSASAAMAVMTGIALVCYGANLYLLRPDQLGR